MAGARPCACTIGATSAARYQANANQKRTGRCAMSKNARIGWTVLVRHRDADRRPRRGLCPGPRLQSVSSRQGIGGWRRAGGAGARVGKAPGWPRDGTAGRGSCRRRRREHLGLHPLRRDEPAAGRARRPVRSRLHVSRRQAQAARHDLQVRPEGQRREKLRRPDVHLAARALCRPRRQCLGDRCGLRRRRGDGRQGRREGRARRAQVQPGRRSC